MTDLWQKLKTDKNPIYLYGMGNGADKVLNTLDALNIKVSGVFVSDDFVRDKQFHGFPLMSYSWVCEKHNAFTVIVCFGSSLPDVMENIKRIAAEQTLYVPDLPVFGDGLFDIDYCRKNRKRLENIYERLEDAVSKHTFESLVRFKISGDISYLTGCETENSEPFKSFLGLKPDSVFFDLGAYRGDTLCEFIQNVGGYKKACALEPDKRNFLKLQSGAPENTVCVNAAASDKDGVCFFEVNSGRGSHISAKGREVASVCVDSLAKDNLPDYIKMDVEGNEKNAVLGAKETIINYKPKMCIAAYHRAFDLVDIPEQMLSLNPHYKLYLRHFPYIPAWDTNYYFI